MWQRSTCDSVFLHRPKQWTALQEVLVPSQVAMLDHTSKMKADRNIDYQQQPLILGTQEIMQQRPILSLATYITSTFHAATTDLVSTSGTDVAAVPRPSNNTDRTALRERRRGQRLDGRLASRAAGEDKRTGADLCALRAHGRRDRRRGGAPLLAGHGGGGAGGHGAGRVGAGRADVGAVRGPGDDRHRAALGQRRRGQRRHGEVAAAGARDGDLGAVADDLRRRRGRRRDGRRRRAPVLARQRGGARGHAGRGAGRAVAAAWVVDDVDRRRAGVLRDDRFRDWRVGSWPGRLARRARRGGLKTDGKADGTNSGGGDRSGGSGALDVSWQGTQESRGGLGGSQGSADDGCQM